MKFGRMSVLILLSLWRFPQKSVLSHPAISLGLLVAVTWIGKLIHKLHGGDALDRDN